MGNLYALKTVSANMTAHSGFIWPRDGKVVAPDWAPTNECGKGLHAALWGEGDGGLFNWDEDAVWLVLKIDEGTPVIDLGGEVKFPECHVIYAGPRDKATAMLRALGARGAIIGGTATAGDNGTATAGDYGTATAGDHGTATAGDFGTATAGDYGTATAGHEGTAAAGHKGTATAGYCGTATAGDFGTATVGYEGTATAGDHGTATAGDYGAAKAGEGGMLCLRGFKNKRPRLFVAYVGENGIKPNVAYRLDHDGNFEEA